MYKAAVNIRYCSYF